ncbi:MAG: hypothetical protein ABI843_11720 [Dokdonella sp.]
MNKLHKTRHFRLSNELELQLVELSKRVCARPSDVIRQLIAERFARTEPTAWTRGPQDARLDGGKV